MDHSENLLVHARREAKTTAQSLAAIETVLLQMDALVTSLDRRVAVEEKRTRITNVNHIAYSTIAMAARVRSDNLKKSLIELKARLLVATANHSNALAKLSALEKKKSQDAVRLLELPVSNANRHRKRPRLRSYQRRAVIVFAPSNDNLANIVASSVAELFGS
jgi:hypothetical protein